MIAILTNAVHPCALIQAYCIVVIQ
jgi:hypothetical protein